MRRGPSTGADVQESETGTVDPQHMQAGVANKGYNTQGGTSKGDNKSDEYDNDTGKDGSSSEGGKGVKESVEQAVVSPPSRFFRFPRYLPYYMRKPWMSTPAGPEMKVLGKSHLEPTY